MGPLIRIICRVAAGFLIGRGWVSLDAVDQVFNDPASDAAFDVIAGGVVWIGTEGFYVLARKLRWQL